MDQEGLHQKNEGAASREPTKKRIATHVSSIDTLVGGHPEALREIYSDSEPATVDALGERPRGRLLSLEQTAGFHILIRPLLQIVSTTLMPWEGIVFDHGGNAGANIVLGREVLRFRAERTESVLDGHPTLVLTYPKTAWLRAELRMVSDDVGLGVTLVRGVPVTWFGLSR